MPSYVTPRKNTEYVFYVGLVDADDATRLQSSATIAAGDFKVSTDGGALVSLDGTGGNAIPVVTPASSKSVKITLQASVMNGDNIVVICSDQTDPEEWADALFDIQTSARQIDDLATPTNITAGTITTVTNLTNAPTAGDLTADMKTSVNAEVLDVMTVDTFAEVGQEAPAATQTILKMVQNCYKAFRNKMTVGLGVGKLYNDAGTVVDQKWNVSDAGGVTTKDEVESGP